MTWDVYAVKAPGARTVEQIPEGLARSDIGNPDDVVEAVRRVAPHLDAKDPRWLRLEGPDHEIEVALGKGIRVHDVRAARDALAVVERLTALPPDDVPERDPRP